MPFIVVYDAEALYGNAHRDLLIRIAQHGLVQAKWTDEILDEMLRNLGKNRPDIPEERRSRLRDRMNEAVADCLVTGYEPFIEILELPDPDDRHVLAAAIRSGAQVIVTRNTKDFPAERLQPWNIEAKIPDDFVLDQIGIDARIVYACVQEIASSRTNPPGTVEDVLGELERAGLVQSVAALRLG
jgi:predicted nucleic acid-binding protein